MIYTYALILAILYILFEVIVRKKEKALLIALIPAITVLLIKHTRLSNLINEDITFIITIISILITIILLGIYLYNLIKRD